MLSGFLLINKPSGPTSHDIIDRLRRITGVRKIGHAGTLDPFASGLLIVAVERQATKELGRFVKMDKEYLAEIRFGCTSDTQDRTGKINIDPEAKAVGEEQVKEALERFVGKQNQLPPMYSAKKIGGRKLYELARRGETVERAAAEIEIFNLELLSFDWPKLKIRIRCSSGTYIRTLAHDLGQHLGCGALTEELERTAINGYNLKGAVKLPELQKNWQSYLSPHL
jgi:tRNA pseudouridine55 synthase